MQEIITHVCVKCVGKRGFSLRCCSLPCQEFLFLPGKPAALSLEPVEEKNPPGGLYRPHGVPRPPGRDAGSRGAQQTPRGSREGFRCCRGVRAAAPGGTGPGSRRLLLGRQPGTSAGQSLKMPFFRPKRVPRGQAGGGRPREGASVSPFPAGPGPPTPAVPGGG